MSEQKGKETLRRAGQARTTRPGIQYESSSDAHALPYVLAVLQALAQLPGPVPEATIYRMLLSADPDGRVADAVFRTLLGNHLIDRYCTDVAISPRGRWLVEENERRSGRRPVPKFTLVKG